MSYIQQTTLDLPTIVNIAEARQRCHEFNAVITAGPRLREVSDFNHPNHKVVEFDDTTLRKFGGPQYNDVKTLITWGSGQENLLVHCHAGISRSTATAWGIAIANGRDPEEAFLDLKAKHPTKERFTVNGAIEYDIRPFSPNELIVEHLEKLFNIRDLHKINDKHSAWGRSW